MKIINFENIEDCKVVEGKLDQDKKWLDDEGTNEYVWEISDQRCSFNSSTSEESNPQKVYFYKKDMDQVIELPLDEILKRSLKQHLILQKEEDRQKEWKDKQEVLSVKGDQFLGDIDYFLGKYETFLIDTVKSEMKEKNLNFTLTNIRKVLRENCYSPKFNNDDFKNEKGVYFHYREWRPTKTYRKLWMNKEWFDQHTKELLEIIESRFKNVCKSVTFEQMKHRDHFIDEYLSLEDLPESISIKKEETNYYTDKRETKYYKFPELGGFMTEYDSHNLREIIFTKFISIYEDMKQKDLEYWTQ